MEHQVVVNGQPTTVKGRRPPKIIHRALEATGNLREGMEHLWELRDSSGVVLGADERLPFSTQLYLSQKAGVGG